MPAEMTHDPAMGGMVQHMQLTPLFVKLRFGMWQEVLAEPAPPADMPYMGVMWHTAQGIAHANQGQLDAAQKDLAEVARLKNDPSIKTLAVSPINPATSIVAIAHEILAAEIATAKKQAASAIQHFAAAVKLEDGLTYTESPDWPLPVRQLQGAAMLELGRYKEAEAAFRGDMKKFPDNGWSLSGLAEALDKQEKTAEAAAAQAKFTEMWKAADVEVVAGRAK
jgi:predicted Zn-dependent protease